MKKILFRILSYIIDMLVIVLITTLLSMTLPFLNKNKINDMTAEYSEHYMTFSKFFTEFEDKYTKDKIITTEEFNEISENYEGIFDYALEDYVDKELTDEDKEKIVEIISTKSIDNLNSLNYKIVKINLVLNIVQLGLVVIYFGLIQFLLKGQTLGKKLLRLYVVNEDDSNVELYKMLLRSLLVTTIIISIIEGIVANSVDAKAFTNFSKYYSYVPSAYALIMFMFMLFRDDQRGLHDLLLGTKVKLLNKDGSEYTSKIFMEVDEEEKKEEVKEVKYKEKKKTTSKKSSKKKTK